jgi:hypothetical protein
MQSFVEALEQRVFLSAAHAHSIAPHVVVRHNASVPYDLTAAAQPGGTIQLSWADDNPNVKQFIVQRAISKAGFKTVARVRSTTNYSDAAVIPNTSYTYRIYAANVLTPSATASAGVLSVSLVTRLNHVQVSWQPLSSSPQSFAVYRSLAPSSSGNSPLALVLVGTTTGTSLTDNAPDDGNTYTYLVESTTGDSGSSVPVTIWPLPVSNFVSTTFLGADSHYSVQLTWINNSQYVSQFEIERSTDGGQTWPVVYYVPAPATQFVDTDVPDGVTLQYQIAEIPA